MRTARLPVCASALLVSVACGRVSNRSEQVLTPADSADQVMMKLRFNLTNQGVRNAYVEADSAYEYDNSGHTDLKNVKVTFYDSTGHQTSVLTAQTGFYQMRTGAMEARGNVVVTRTDSARLMTSVLDYDQAKNQVSTAESYTYQKGEQHGQGIGFTSDPSFSNIVSKAVRGTAGHFTLPGQ